MTGSVIGLGRRGTIINYNGDGTVNVKLERNDVDSFTTQFDIPLLYSTPSGGLIAGYPEVGTPVLVKHEQGEWLIDKFLVPDAISSNYLLGGTGSSIEDSISGDVLGNLLPGRILIQSSKLTNRIYLDSQGQISIGADDESVEIDTKRDIYLHNLKSEIRITSAGRHVEGSIKRDVVKNSLRNIDYSSLRDPEYDDSLKTVGMDKGSEVSFRAYSPPETRSARNLPLVESRYNIYEFNYLADAQFREDKIESEKYLGFVSPPKAVQIYDSRATLLNLNLHNPNVLIESLQGTCVDSLTNILDINRNVLPIGNVEEVTLNNKNNFESFREIRSQHRKSIAYHFELNARKSAQKYVDPNISSDFFDSDPIYEVPNINYYKDMARDRSTLFVDLDKEGQIKVNVPMSSEVGNVALPTRYVNASKIAYDKELISDPNQFLDLDERRKVLAETYSTDIYLESFSNFNTGVSLLDSSGKSTSPLDRRTGQNIKLNTVYHDILEVGSQFKTDRAGNLAELIPNSQLNINKPTINKYKNFISDTIYTDGPKANAGGRSVTANLDGSVNFSIGANTVDRQSVWLDTAGGVVASIGRDRRNVSFVSNLDGDLLVQVGQTTTAGMNDSRFSGENDAEHWPAVDIRVATQAGWAVFRIDDQGYSVYHPGRAEIASGKNLILRSNADILLFAENITYQSANAGNGRTIKRHGSTEI